MSIHLRRLALALPLALSLGACTTWGRRPMPAPGEDRFYRGPVRVIRTEGSPLLLDRVTVSRDSVVGWEHALPHGRVAIPTSDVRLVEARRTSVTAVAAVIVVSAAAFVLVLANLAQSECACVSPS